MRQKLAITFAALLLVAAAAVADHEKKGKIVRVDPDAHVMVIQSEKGDQWDLSWTETTKFEDNVTATELRPGDKVEFEFVERDGRMWATKIEREKKAD